MALTPAEEQELAMLEQQFVQKPIVKSQSQPMLSQQEEQELAMLEQEFSQKVPTTTKTEAFIQGAGQGLSLGYLPQIQAATEPYIQKALDFFGGDNTNKQLEQQGFKIQNLPEQSYVQRRDEAIKRSQQMEREQPGASMAGQIAGAIPSAVGIGGVFKAGAGAAGKIAQAAKSGGLIGAVRNPGDTEGEVAPLQAKDRALNVLKDAATGAVLQGGIESVGKIAKTLKQAPESLQKWSQLKSVKAGGAMLKDFRKQFGNKKAYELGQTIIDNGIVSVGDDIAEIAVKAEGLKNISGQKIGQIYSQGDEALATLKQQGKVTDIDLQEFANDYAENIANKYSGKAGATSIINKVTSELEQIGSNGQVSLSKLKEVRQSLDDMINYSKANNELKPIQSEFLEMRNKMQELAKGKLGEIDRLSGTDLSKQFTKENKNFSSFADVATMAKDKAARESSNGAFGLRERISGGVGGAIGSYTGAAMAGPAGAVVGGLVGGGIGSISTKVARKYGTPYVAISANKIAKALARNQGALDKFSDPLIKAAEKSPKEFVNAVNILLSKPEFKRKVRNLKIEE